ncbi:MAG: NAD-dependent epimerase/dehydratase, partial [uncultured Nocardioides sp.]
EHHPRRHRSRTRGFDRRPAARGDGGAGAPADPIRQRSRAPAGRATPSRRLAARAAGARPRRRDRGAPLHPWLPVRRPHLARGAPGRRASRAGGRGPGRGGGRLPREPLLLRSGRRPTDGGHPPDRDDRQAGRADRAARPAGGVVHPDGQRRGLRLLRPARPERPRRRTPGPHGAGRAHHAHGGEPGPAALLHLRAGPGCCDDRRRVPAGPVEHRAARADGSRRHPAASRRAGRRRGGRGGAPHVGDPALGAADGRGGLARHPRAGRDHLHVHPALRPGLHGQPGTVGVVADAHRDGDRGDRRVVAVTEGCRESSPDV